MHHRDHHPKVSGRAARGMSPLNDASKRIRRCCRHKMQGDVLALFPSLNLLPIQSPASFCADTTLGERAPSEQVPRGHFLNREWSHGQRRPARDVNARLCSFFRRAPILHS
jgi:hypothetical protein